jgi:alpha-tubulin suppressor-like RCC1 family protein
VSVYFSNRSILQGILRMNTINVSNLVLTLQQKIDNSTNETDILYYARAIQQLRTGHIFVVDTTSQLPANSQQNVGALYYVRSDDILYLSTTLAWKPLNRTVSAIFSWGRNSNSELGNGTTNNSLYPVREFCSAINWCQVSAGNIRTHAINTSGQLWGWGYGGQGRLGDGRGSGSRCSPVLERCSATDWCQVKAGDEHAAAVKTTGQLWAWGTNACGALGDGTTVTRCSPVRERCSDTSWCQVSAGDLHTAAVKTSGQLWTWGYNGAGRLGNGTTVTSCSPIREFCSETDWCQVSAGCLNTAAIKTTGQLWSWGNNGSGALGDGTATARCSPVREFCSATDWRQVDAGYNAASVLAIKTSGELWVWGSNDCGQLGDGTFNNRCSPVREFCSATDWCQVSAGFRRSGAVKTSGQLWSWGDNRYGQLGDGTFTLRTSPVREITSGTDWCQVGAAFRQTAAILFLN